MDLAAFRLRFPQFAAKTDDELNAAAADAAIYLSPLGNSGDALREMLMAAHILTLRDAAQQPGATVGRVTSATDGKISITVADLPTRSAWDDWLAATAPGLELLALLRAMSAGGVYVGGRPERAAFRTVGGRFPRGGRSW